MRNWFRKKVITQEEDKLEQREYVRKIKKSDCLLMAQCVDCSNFSEFYSTDDWVVIYEIIQSSGKSLSGEVICPKCYIKRLK